MFFFIFLQKNTRVYGIKNNKKYQKTSKLFILRPQDKGDFENSDFWDFLFKNRKPHGAKNDKKTQKKIKNCSKT